jgi:two-component system sensor histidine kinase TctE
MSRSSLRRRVAVWLLPPLVVLLAINAVLAYRGALDAANLAYDRSLAASIKAIGERSYARNGEIIVDIPYSAFDIFSEGAQERVFYSVIGPTGALLTGYPDLPSPQPVADDGIPITADGVYKGDAVRVGAMRKRLYDPAQPGNDAILVVVAETTETRTELAWSLFYDNLRRQLALVALGVLSLVVALTMAFRPLLRLRDSIRNRNEEDLAPVSHEGVPSEIRPLVDAINNHMARISHMLEARKRFLADAAHQIRTPLTVLGTQAEYGLRQEDPAEMRRTLQSLSHSIRGARRLANQMLALSRAEAVNGLIQEQEPLDLAELVREVALELSPLALRKQIDLAYEGPRDGLIVAGNGSMLREMVANLLDNAIRYTPESGQVTASTRREGNKAVITIADSGPGIPPTEREKVFLRFYRSLEQQDTEGSGLGLAIVREICKGHGGSVSLDSGPGGHGLEASARLPLADFDRPPGVAPPRAA